jgi:hypothetical protein
MQALGYPIPDRRPAAAKKPRQPTAASPTAAQQAAKRAAAAAGRPVPVLNPRAAAPALQQEQQQQQVSSLTAAGTAPRPTFEDVSVPEPVAFPRSNGSSTSALFTSAAAPATRLLAGTELEAASELRPRPVKVRAGAVLPRQPVQYPCGRAACCELQGAQ